MTYFLDFDRTLFNTSSFIAYVIRRESLSYLNGLTEVEKATEFASLADKGQLSFAPGELTQFMFPDGQSFLDAHPGECVIVTFGNMALQTGKLESAFHGRKNLEFFCTGLEPKGPFLSRMAGRYSRPQVFIDDKPLELNSVHAECPDISLYEMRRDDLPADGRYPVIHSFSELP